jgi:hypothetical protein
LHASRQFLEIVLAKSKLTHAEHGETNPGLGHDQHRALDDAWRLDVPPMHQMQEQLFRSSEECEVTVRSEPVKIATQIFSQTRFSNTKRFAKIVLYLFPATLPSKLIKLFIRMFH